MEQKTFHSVDYVVMVAFLSVSLGVGIYHGVFKKQKTTEEYLLGNRRLLMLPVAMSLVVSFQSAVSLMGAPAEMYVYDTMIVWQWASVLLSFVLQAYFLVTLIYPLKLVSAYKVPLEVQFFGKGDMKAGRYSEEMFRELVSMAPDYVILSIGGNAINKKSSPQKIADQIVALVHRMMAHGVRQVFFVDITERGSFRERKLTKKCVNSQRDKVNRVVGRSFGAIGSSVRFPAMYHKDMVNLNELGNVRLFFNLRKCVLSLK